MTVLRVEIFYLFEVAYYNEYVIDDNNLAALLKFCRQLWKPLFSRWHI